jgi:hypothetical protein
MPRYALDGKGIRLIEGPGIRSEDLENDFASSRNPTLREYLRLYDRFYFPVEHEPVLVVGGLLSFKIAVAAWGRYARGRLRRAQFEPGSEAAKISRRIFLKLQEETAARSRQFLLVVLPTATDLDRLQSDPEFANAWQALVTYICAGQHNCVDLVPALRRISADDIDLGPDGNHFGPRANASIAAAVLDALPRRGG